MPTGVYVRTVEARAKLSKAKMGKNNPFYGKHLSEEHKAKLSVAHIGKGHPHTDEAKAKISLAHKGKRFSEEHRAKLSFALMGNHNTLGQCLSEEHKVKISQALKGRVGTFLGKRHSEETKTKLSKALMGNSNAIERQFSEEVRANISRKVMLRWRDPEWRGRVAKVYQTPEFRDKISKNTKLLWQDPEYRDKTVKASRLGNHIHPNKSEIVVLALLDSLYPGEWKFVGDGQLIVAGKNPDFWNGDHKLIEMWGDYWHRGEDPEDRVSLFTKSGYSTLVIWESELDKPEEVLRRLALFAQGVKGAISPIEQGE